MTPEDIAKYRKRTEPEDDWYWSDCTDAKDDVAALLDEIELLQADLLHARHWANRAVEHPSLEIGDAADDQARAYCDAPEHFEARDGWFIGQPVPTSECG